MNHRLNGGFIKKGRLIYQYQTYGLNTTHFLEAVEIYIFFAMQTLCGLAQIKRRIPLKNTFATEDEIRYENSVI